MEERIKKIEEFVGREENGQKWRKITPLGMITNLASNLTIVGMLVWFLNYYIDQEKKSKEVIWATIKEMRLDQAEINRCFNKNFNKFNCRNCDIC